MKHILNYGKNYVGGQWVAASGEVRLEVRNPATEEVIATVVESTVDDVGAAVEAARAALPAWSALSANDRADWLLRVRSVLLEHVDELADLMSLDVGTPRHLSKSSHVDTSVFNLANFAEVARSFEFEGPQVGNSLVVHEPIGVVACITPWNFPLHQVVLKVAGALAAGCTVVVKPSEVAPLAIYKLADIFDIAQFPSGAFNLVNGSGPVAGEALVVHPGVDMVSFTGSTRAGRRIAELASAQVKRVALELGGKGANVILDDAELAGAVADTVGNCFYNSGQTCGAFTRMLVPAGKLAEAERLAAEVAAQYPIGDPTVTTTALGPLVNANQRERVQRYIASGIEEGARLIVGGAKATDMEGYFVEPTVFSGVAPDMTIAQEEIFGPVLSIIPYDSDADAIRIANGTPYGLTNGVWSADPERAMQVARQLKSGQVTINGADYNPGAPFGGYKGSGLGREAGKYGLEEFLEVKAIQR